MPKIKKQHKKKARNHARKKTADKQKDGRTRMTLVAWLLAAAFAVTLGLALNYGQNKHYVPAIWWGFACFVVVGLGIVYTLLDWAGKAANKAAPPDVATTALKNLVDQTAIANRPYVDVLNPVLGPLKVGQRPTVTVTMKNTGRTPAIDLQAGSRLQIGAIPLFPDNAYEPTDERPVTLGAGESIQMTIPGDHALTPEELDGLRPEWLMDPSPLPNGTIFSGRHLKAHGEIVYCGTGNTRPLPHVHFCFVYDPLGKRMIVCDQFGNHEDLGHFRNAIGCRPADEKKDQE